MSQRHSRRQVLYRDLPKEVQKEISEAYIRFDSDKSGFIDRHELRAALRALGFDITKEEAYDILDNNNAQKSGLTREQFLQVAAEKVSQRSPNEELAKSFKLFDSDNDRKIDLKDLQKVCYATGIDFDEPTLREMIEMFAPEGCDYITMKEFMEIISPTSSVFN